MVSSAVGIDAEERWPTRDTCISKHDPSNRVGNEDCVGAIICGRNTHWNKEQSTRRTTSGTGVGSGLGRGEQTRRVERRPTQPQNNARPSRTTGPTSRRRGGGCGEALLGTKPVGGARRKLGLTSRTQRPKAIRADVAAHSTAHEPGTSRNPCETRGPRSAPARRRRRVISHKLLLASAQASLIRSRPSSSTAREQQKLSRTKPRAPNAAPSVR